MSHPVKLRVALVVIEVEAPNAFEASSAASSVISQAIISAFTARDDATLEADDDEQLPPGEVKQ